MLHHVLYEHTSPRIGLEKLWNSTLLIIVAFVTHELTNNS